MRFEVVGGFGGLAGKDTLQYVREWVPEENYREVDGFREELRDHLDDEFNHGVVGMGMGNVGDDVPVRTDDSSSGADVIVGDEVAVTLVQEFTARDVETVRDRIETCTEAFSVVIVVACGVRDETAWEELQTEYRGSHISVTSSPDVHFVRKKRTHFGRDPPELQDDDGGLLDRFF